MFNKKYRKYIQSFLLVLPMTGIVTGINTLIAKGAQNLFTAPTFHRWGISFLVAYPCVLVIQPLAVKITNRLIKPEK
ncbi:DUF2798 domain-containing protein [Candidatus Saccharibacteria bacterium]|nr:DUF2798 domain-containing protein [Candidatus Saccharibacteria bacterium]